MTPDNVIDYAIEGYNKPGAVSKGEAKPQFNTYVKSVKEKSLYPYGYTYDPNRLTN